MKQKENEIKWRTGLLTLCILLLSVSLAESTDLSAFYNLKGKEINLSIDESTPTIVAMSINDYKEYIDAISAKDTEGAFALLLAERIIQIPSGTKVRVLDIEVGKQFYYKGSFHSRDYVKIRILEGDYYPLTGWISSTVISNYINQR